MSSPLRQRLLRAAGLDATSGVPQLLSGLASHLQRSLGVALGGAEPGIGARGTLPDPAAALVRTADLLTKAKENILRRPAAFTQASRTPMQARTFSGSAGSRPYKLFVPAQVPPSPGLIVMLHGCSQSAEDFAAGTRMNDVAGAQGFLVLYPEQIKSANMQRCWNWFNPADQQRGQGEPDLIAGMTREVMAEFGVDPARVFAAGLSAGGATAAIMGAAYPDLYAAIGVHSGLACGAAHDMASAFAAMRQGRQGHGSLTIPTIIFQGDKDGTVNPANAAAVAAQLGDLGPAEVEEGKVPEGLAFTKSIRRGPGRRPVLEQWIVHGAGHAWSGGSGTGSFTEPKGPDASREMLRFFTSAGKG